MRQFIIPIIFLTFFLPTFLFGQAETRNKVVGHWSYCDGYTFKYLTLNSNGTYFWYFKSCTGDNEKQGAFSLSGDTIILQNKNGLQRLLLNTDKIYSYPDKDGKFDNFQALAKTNKKTLKSAHRKCYKKRRQIRREIRRQIHKESILPDDLPDKILLRGQLIAWDKESPRQFVGLNAIIKGDGQILTSSYVDTAGQFTLTFQTIQRKTFDLFVAGLGADTSFIQTFTTFNSDTFVYKFNFPMGLEFQIFRCPKCKRADKAYDIIYGDKQIVKQVIKNGDTTYTNIVDRKYYAGTCVQSKLSPHFYCDRCKIKW